MKSKVIIILLFCLCLVGCGVKKESSIKDENPIVSEIETTDTTTTTTERQKAVLIENITRESQKSATDKSKNRIDIGVEINPIQGNKNDYNKLDENTQQILEEYLAGFYVALLDAIENQDIVYEYKNDYIKNFENEFDSLKYTYRNDKNEMTVILDFFQLSYICAIYESQVLNGTTSISNNDIANTIIIDDAYTQYISDLTNILSGLVDEYVS